jgi:hypothetical protein
MQKYKSMYSKQSLKESLSFLDLYKLGSDDVMKMVEEFIKKFNAPRVDIYKAFADLFNVLASEADKQIKEKGKK